MGPMRFFGRPTSDLASDYRTATGRSGKVIATASGPRVELLAFADHFAYRYADQSWADIAWHEVYSGGWKSEAEEIHWRLVDGRREVFHLAEPGRFPEVFRERVQATVVLEQTFEAPGRGDIQVSARHDLTPGATGLVWNVRGLRGADLDDPATRERADELEAMLRADYDF